MVAKGENGTRREGGFSLLELLVVLVIAGLLTSLVPSLLSAAIPGARLKSSAEALAHAIDASKHQAIHSGRIVDVYVDNEPLQYRIGAERTPFPEGVTVMARTSFDLDTSRNRRRNTLPENFRIRFYPDGSSSGGTITVARDNTAYDVSVDWLLGGVRVTRSRDDGLLPR